MSRGQVKGEGSHLVEGRVAVGVGDGVGVGVGDGVGVGVGVEVVAGWTVGS